MDRAQCPSCGCVVGLGTWSDPGDCPTCGTPLMLTCEFPVISEHEGATAHATAIEVGAAFASAPAASIR